MTGAIIGWTCIAIIVVLFCAAPWIGEIIDGEDS